MNGSSVEYIDEPFIMTEDQKKLFFYDKTLGAVRGGNGSGKSLSITFWTWLLRMEEYPEAQHVAVGKTYDQLRDGIFKGFRDTLVEKGLEEEVDFKYRGSPRPWLQLLWNGAKLHSWSADTVNAMRGASIQTLVVEEPQSWGPQGEAAWTSLITRLRHSIRTKTLYPKLDPQCRMSFNPTDVGPGHWLYETMEKRWPQDGYECLQFSTRNNTILLGFDPGYVRRMELSISPDRWPVEIDGEYATRGGDVYRTFDPNVHLSAPVGMPPIALDTTKPLAWGFDWNVGFMCSTLAQFHMQPTQSRYVAEPNQIPGFIEERLLPGWQTRIAYFIDEICLPDSGVEDIVPFFLAKDGGRYADVARRHGLVLYGDQTGGRSPLVSATNPVRTSWGRIFADLRAAGIPFTIRVPSHNPLETDRINLFKDQLRTGDGYGALFDEQRCVELLTDIRQNRYKPGTNEMDKSMSTPASRRRTHAGDSAGYILHVERCLMYRKNYNFEWIMER